MDIEVTDGGDGLFIRNAHAADGGFQGGELLVEYFEDADEVAGISDVHGVGERGPGGAGFVLAGLQVDGNGIIGVAGGDKVFNGQTGAPGHEPGADIAEVAAGDADDGGVGFIGPL